MKKDGIAKKSIKISSVIAMAVCLAAVSACGTAEQVTPGGSQTVTIDGLSDVSVEAGETYRFLGVTSSDGGELGWVSSNESVATIELTGGLATLTALSAGVTEITAFSSRAQTTCTVTVTADGSSQHNVTISISESFIDVETGAEAEITASSSDGGEVYWYSADGGIAEVSGGTITGIADGTTTITACTAWAQAECTVAVNTNETLPFDDDKTLVWSDEFEGDSLNTDIWGYQTGTHDIYHGLESSTNRWGNNEQQYYTEDAASVSDGCLKITATKEDKEDCSYTSARILTRYLYTVTYGYIEARIKMPAITGMWPAFWMLPQPTDYTSTNNIYGGWSQSGEIDIMEARGRLSNTVCGTLHYGRTQYTGYDYYFGDNTSIANWHTYAVEWRADHITWYVDGVEYFTMDSSQWYTDASDSAAAPFDQPFYILLNLAVGGNFDGNNLPPDSFTSASMYVDYVRVYE